MTNLTYYLPYLPLFLIVFSAIIIIGRCFIKMFISDKK